MGDLVPTSCRASESHRRGRTDGHDQRKFVVGPHHVRRNIRHMNPYAEAFLASRNDIVQMLRTIPASEWNQVSPLTPEWTCKEVVAHLVGLGVDVAEGNLPPRDMNAWTASQVRRFGSLSPAELIERWETTATEATFNEAFAQMLFDQITHEFDLRYAFAIPGDTHSARVLLAADFLTQAMKDSYTLDYDLTHRAADIEGPAVVATPFEILRARSGRRSWNQIAAMDWNADLAEVKASFFGNGFFEPQPDDVEVAREAH